jgi:hypothetical protein
MRERFVDTVKQEIAEEQAGALGRSGRRLEQVLALLRAHEASSARNEPRESASRERLLWELAERVEAFIVHREACGLRDFRHVLEHYQIPGEVLARVGARRPSANSSR